MEHTTAKYFRHRCLVILYGGVTNGPTDG